MSTKFPQVAYVHGDSSHVRFHRDDSCQTNRVLRTRLQVQRLKHCDVLLSFRPMAENSSHPLREW